MTVNNDTNVKRESGDGITTQFNFPFKIFEDTDLEVYKIDTSVSPEVATLQVLNTDYTVSISQTSEGGSVTYTTAPTSDEDSFIKRVMPFTQEKNFEPNINFPEKNIEDEFDKSRMLDIQLEEEKERTLRLNEFTEYAGELEIPEPVASRVIGFDSTGLQVTLFSGSDLDTILTSVFGQQLVQSADAATARDFLELGSSSNVEFNNIVCNQITATTYVGIPEASTTVKGIVELATQAEAEAKSDNTRALTPYSIANLAAAVWVSINGNSGAIRNSFGVSGVVKDGTGLYTITFTNAFSDAEYCYICTVKRQSTDTTPASARMYQGTYQLSDTKSTTQLQIRVQSLDASGYNGVEDVDDVNVVIFGS